MVTSPRIVHGRRRHMGTLRIDIEVARPGRRAVWHTVPRALVDTGSEMTWLPAALLRALGVTVFKRDQAFLMANGQPITRDVGIALLRCGEFKTVDEVVFAHADDLMLVGARTLQGFNAVVDRRRKRLVAAGPMPAAVA